MGIEDKIDKLNLLLEDMVEREEYELCHQIKKVIDRWNKVRDGVNGICPKCNRLIGEDGVCWKCLTK